MNKAQPIVTRGYPYQAIMKAVYVWLPVFAVVIFACSFSETFRFVLYATVVSGTYALILKQLKKKSIPIDFDQDKIQVNNNRIFLANIEDYCITLPLNELLLLRLKTKEKQEAFYIEKEAKASIEDFFSQTNIPLKQTGYDTYLKYSHLILPFVGLFICAVMYKLFQYIQYGLH
jgi:hypothetical protein